MLHNGYVVSIHHSHVFSIECNQFSAAQSCFEQTQNDRIIALAYGAPGIDGIKHVPGLALRERCMRGLIAVYFESLRLLGNIT